MRVLTFFMIALLGFSGLRVLAQEPFYNHYTTEDGLPSIECYDILQDSAGFIWIGTDKGLARFDGSTIRQFTTKDGLPGNVVTTLYPAADGHIWANCYERGMAHADGMRISAPTWNEAIAKRNHRIDDFLDKGNGDAVVTYFSSKFHRSIATEIADSVVVNDHVETGESFVVWATKFQGNQAFGYRNPPASNAALLNIKGDGFPNGSVRLGEHKVHVTDAVIDRQGETLFLSGVKEVIAISTSLEVMARYPLPSRATNSLMIDHQGDLWLGTLEHGLFRFTQGDLTSEPERFLDEYSVTSVYEDRDGGIWMCTIQDGIYHLPFADLSIFTKASGLPEKRATYALQSGNEAFFIFRDGAMLKAPLSTTNPKFDLMGDVRYVYDAFVDADGLLNVAIDPVEKLENDQVKRLNPTSYIHRTAGDSLLVARIGRVNQLIVGTDTTYLTQQGELPRTYAIETTHDNYYFGTKSGLYCMNKAAREPVWLGDTSDILASSISYLKRWQGHLLIGTAGQGLLIMNKDHQSLRFNTNNGLSSDYINKVYVDSHDRMWICTPNGIDMVSLHEKDSTRRRFLHVGIEQGLPVPSVNDMLIYNEHLWALTDGGIAIIPISTIEDNTPPTLYLNRIEINGIERGLIDEQSLSYTENNLEFNYEVISYKNQSRQRFYYHLGHDAESGLWRSTASRSLTFANLSPGEYTLHLQSAQGDVPDQARLTYHFEILKPLWQRWYTLTALAIAFALALTYFTQLRIAGIRRRAEIQERISTLNYNALRAQMNPHFIYNALNAIQNFIINQDQKKSITFLGNFSKLIRSIFENSSRAAIPLKDEVEMVELYAGLEAARYPDRFSLEVAKEKGVEGLRVPPMLLQPFVENAILHGVLTIDEPGLIQLNLKKEKGYLCVQVQDNGIGIKKGREIGARKRKYLDHLKNRGRQSGMVVTEERIKHLAKRYRIPFLFRIEDLSEEDPTQHGTRVSFHIPYLAES